MNTSYLEETVASNHSTNETSLFRPRAIAAALWLNLIGSLMVLIQPVIIGASANQFSLNNQQLGYFSAALLLLYSLSSTSALFWVRRYNWQYSAAISLALFIIGCFIGFSSQLYISKLIGFACISLGSGALYSLSLIILSDTANPDRAFGYAVSLQVTGSSLLIFLTPQAINLWGFDSIYSLMAILALSGLAVIYWLPCAGRAVADLSPSALGVLANPKALLSVAACFLFFFNIGSVWTYIERMGVASNLSTESASTLLAIAAMIAIIGSLAASYLGDRYGRIRPLGLATAGIVLAVYGLSFTISAEFYFMAALLYAAMWNFSMPYQYAAVNQCDPSGKAVALTPAFQTLGGAMGPAAAGLLISNSNFIAVGHLATGGVVLSLCLFALALKNTGKTI
ncbi:MFS transporter [Dasania sp. GY-MA-18]|uniref:MFS transporter n=1 Tax=Dasania phycosphaerae TaxID=2950436 RepID=A0A9J6RM30_9GAMM|nr:MULTISPECIES: MFS transporter [Dasania]MCR8923084.1 MFS transporter [Dasania sp. GY-MA-18]MCZ0865516.1 MFS transporter [Dasania phycosphaerae]MCZ0869241.1 MFS transporter [Dasania phycosphaerae]